ncbi:hypothetical protein PVAND_010497 [Polypedilum vanderplanki]|uniref:C2H2-type domain-containing protein n=1 Tax=Polypedilum vanderplanki TaxID=319348 RepID=A0A9J6CGM1_POLVA|nr:hypothetical protein PVAND_010497 [Polypedilum vanderplanki]
MTSSELQIVIDITPENIELKQYICNASTCNKEFSNEQALKKHIITHDSSYNSNETAKITYSYSCPVAICRRSITKDYFQTRKQLVQHFFKVHNTKKFSCTNENCDKKFSTEVLRNLHLKCCGKVFNCEICSASYNSNEALITHRKRKNHFQSKCALKDKKIATEKQVTRSVATTTTTSTLSKPSVGTNTSWLSATKSTITDDVLFSQKKNSSTSTDDFMKEESSNSRSSSSSQNKKTNVNWSLTGGEFEEDSITLFDNDVKMEFYSTETQTDFSENLFNNNYTQTSFADFYDFEKFDGQTQTNWDEYNQGF